MKHYFVIGCFLLGLNSSVIAQEMSDSVLLVAYQHEDMSTWKEYLMKVESNLLYEYGLCGYMADRDKEHALPYVQRFKAHVEAAKSSLPKGHYEMYRSAVYVYELRLHESIHPVRAMNLAKEAVKLAPQDPLVLSYYGTCLFYAPKPFGSKEEALTWFTKAQQYFVGDKWKYCWVREANEMYIRQCREKLKKQ